jgi:predicted NACHT family NTPase
LHTRTRVMTISGAIVAAAGTVVTKESAKAIGGALSKAAISWLTSDFLRRQESKKKKAADEKSWNEVASGIVKQTKDMANRLSKITTVAFPNHPVPLESIYVPLTLKVANSDESCLVNNFPKGFFHKNKKLILVDVAGMGKSTLSRTLFISALEEKVHLPVLIDLRRLTRNSKIEAVLAEQFGIKQSNYDTFVQLILSKPILYIFDGFDEVADDEKNEVARVVRNFVDRAPAANFLITSRPELLFSDYTDFCQVRIQGLTKDEAHELVKKYGSAFEIEDRAKSLLEELRARHDEPIHSFLENPLLTSLLFRAYDYKSIIPVKRSLFYKQVFDALYESHDLNKETAYVRGKRTGLHHDEFHAALRAIASQFRQRKVIEVSVNEFIAMAKEVSTLRTQSRYSPEMGSSLSGLINPCTTTSWPSFCFEITQDQKSMLFNGYLSVRMSFQMKICSRLCRNPIQSCLLKL